MIDPPKRKRRWFQFSLRSLLVIATIVAVQCAVCLPMLREWQTRTDQTERDEKVRAILNTWLMRGGGVEDGGAVSLEPTRVSSSRDSR